MVWPPGTTGEADPMATAGHVLGQALSCAASFGAPTPTPPPCPERLAPVAPTQTAAPKEEGGRCRVAQTSSAGSLLFRKLALECGRVRPQACGDPLILRRQDRSAGEPGGGEPDRDRPRGSVGRDGVGAGHHAKPGAGCPGAAIHPDGERGAPRRHRGRRGESRVDHERSPAHVADRTEINLERMPAADGRCVHDHLVVCRRRLSHGALIGRGDLEGDGSGTRPAARHQEPCQDCRDRKHCRYSLHRDFTFRHRTHWPVRTRQTHYTRSPSLGAPSRHGPHLRPMRSRQIRQLVCSDPWGESLRSWGPIFRTPRPRFLHGPAPAENRPSPSGIIPRVGRSLMTPWFNASPAWGRGSCAGTCYALAPSWGPLWV